MLRHILRRLLLAIPTLWAVVTIIFLVVRVVPGDPARAVLGDYASEETINAYREQMGLNDSLWVQYKNYIFGLLQGDLGNSLVTRTPAWDQIRNVLPHTIELSIAAIILALAVGIPMGVISAMKRNTTIDYVTRVVSLAGLSAPAFYIGLLLMYIFAAKLGWFPAVGAGDFSDPWDNLRRLVLPALTLGMVETASVTRMTRSVMLNVLNADYVRTARAKGLVESRVMREHALRSAMVPIISLVGIFTIGLIGGSVLTEQVFGRPGLGSRLVGATRQFDYNMVQAIMVVYAFIIVIVNIIVDIVYTYVDPRVRNS
ncbi:MAG: ABC transporter permease [Thermomicrobiales bacterium]|nr:ABC transporter permease [Thermomicrobiales bacterium]MCO5219806.1 ABC transporter permease [Thermomicrobiales bacterium]MCO5224757.1 ABC transporter permease [Thermomicrobiales bacterium]MCO5228415.1 ABC transporter permease [Thermomicrobiales bacterium]